MLHNAKESPRNEINTWIDLTFGSIEEGRTVELTVLSGSMMPLLIPGKKIRIGPAGTKKIIAGSIIVFRQGKDLIVHRVLLRVTLCGRRFYLQKGDTNRYASWISDDNIAGKLISTQTSDGTYRSLDSEKEILLAKRKAIKELFKYIIAVLLHVPRKIKHGITAKK